MLNRLQSLDAIDAPFALGERILPPAPVAAIAPQAVADWTRATMADMANVLTDAERSALAEAFPPVSRSSDTDPGLRGVAERMATAKPNAEVWIKHNGGGLPVLPDTQVLVLFRYQAGDPSDATNNAYAAPAGDYSSPNFRHDWWQDRHHDMDIVAYRVVPQ